MAKEKSVGKILILDLKRKFGLEDAGHDVWNFGSIDADRINEALMKDEYDFIVVPDDGLANEKIEAVPEQYRSKILIVSYFDLASSKEVAYRKMEIVNFVRIDGVAKLVKELLLWKEKEKKKADKQEKK